MTAEQVVRVARISCLRPLGAVSLSLATVLLFTAVLGVAFLPSELRRLADEQHLAVVRCHFLDDADQAIALTRLPNFGLRSAFIHRIALHDLAGEQPMLPLVSTVPEPLLTAISADHRWLFYAGACRNIFAIDLQAKGHQPRRLGRHRGEGIWELACSADGSLVVSGGRNGLCAWNVAEGSLLWQREDRRVSCWALNPGSRCLLVEFQDGLLEELDCQTGLTLRTVRSSSDSHVAIKLSSAGDVLALLGRGGELDAVNVETGQSVWPASALPRLAYPVPGAVQFSHCGRWLVTAAASDLYSLTVWNAVSGERLGDLPGHQGAVNGAEFTPDGRLHSWSADGTIRTWNCQSLAAIRVVRLGQTGQPQHLSPPSSEASFLAGEPTVAGTLAAATAMGDRWHE